MSDHESTSDDLESQDEAVAPTWDSVVIGAGVAGLTVAYDLAHRGYRVLVLEATDRVGGIVAAHDVGGITLDRGAESFAVRGGHVAELLEEIGLGDDVETPKGGGAWLTLAGRSVPLPKGSILGIPAQPLAADVINVLGIRGAFRAYLDRIMPVMKIGKDVALGPLVERRMGKAVLARLVSPISGGVYSSDARNLDVAVVAPGLNEAMTRAGSLSGGVAQIVADRKTPGAAVQGITGGMHRLPTALAEQAQRYRAEIRTDAPVVGLSRTESGWDVVLGDDDATVESASSVIVATPAADAAALLESVEGFESFDAPTGANVELVTLVVDYAPLDAAPRGSGALVAEDAGIGAKALTHATAKWEWLQSAANGSHVLRLSYGRVGEEPITTGMGDPEVVDMARRDAEAILGVPVPSPRAAARVRHVQAQPSAAVGARERADQIRERTAEVANLEVVGAWVAGTGLAQVIPDARSAALRIRRENFVVPGRPWTADDDAQRRMES